MISAGGARSLQALYCLCVCVYLYMLMVVRMIRKVSDGCEPI